MTVCKANEVRRTELMKTGYLPQANEAYFIPIALQIEKLNYLVGEKGVLRSFVKTSREGRQILQ